MYIPATDMSLANPKSPTLATTLASTKKYSLLLGRNGKTVREDDVYFFCLEALTN